MADIAINPVTRRVEFTGNTGTGPFAFTFNILQASDIVGYKNSVLQTLTTDYTVTINANGTGSITMVSALVATDGVGEAILQAPGYGRPVVQRNFRDRA